MGDAIDELIADVLDCGRSGDINGAWRSLDPLRDRVDEDPRVAWAWLLLIKNGPDAEARRDEVEEIAYTWEDDARIVNLAAETLYRMVDGRAVDEEVAADDPAIVAAELARNALSTLEARDDEQLRDPEIGGALWWTLANSLRLAGEGHDEASLAAYEAALELHPEEPWLWFDLGLLHKFRRRWEEAIACFERVLRSVPDDEPALNNIAVCATALGGGERATDAWKRLGLNARVGREGLPVVSKLPPLIVRLPVQNDDRAVPVEFEHVWVAPTSPCHGIVLSPPMYSQVANYSDVILFDRAPVGWATRSGQPVPRFPYLDRIERGEAATIPFAAPAEIGEELDVLSDLLPNGARFYRFDTNVALLCADCIRTGEPHDATHRSPESRSHHGPVRGALLIDPEVNLEHVRTLVDSRSRELQLAMPELYMLLGDELGAARARRLLKQF